MTKCKQLAELIGLNLTLATRIPKEDWEEERLRLREIEKSIKSQ